MSADKRSSNRVPLETKVHLEFEKFSGFISEFSHNISEGGMFVTTANPLPIGSIVSFEFKLKDSFQLIQGLGEVSWIRSNAVSKEDPAGMGIRFREISDRSRDLVKAIVSQTKSQGNVPFNIDTVPSNQTEQINTAQMKEVYGESSLIDNLEMKTTIEDLPLETQNFDEKVEDALNNLDASLVDKTFSNPSISSKDLTPADGFDISQATQTALYDTETNQNVLDLNMDEPVPNLAEDSQEQTISGMMEPEALNESFELSLDEEMNDPEFETDPPVDTPKAKESSGSRFGLLTFLSLLIVSLAAIAFTFKDLFIPILQDKVPFVSQWFESEQKTITSPPVNTLPKVDLPKVADTEKEIIEDSAKDNANIVESKIQDITSKTYDKKEVNVATKALKEVPVAEKAVVKKEAKKLTPKVKIKAKELSTTPKPTLEAIQETVINKKPVNTTNKTVLPKAAVEKLDTKKAIDALKTVKLVNGARVKNITWTVDANDWVLIIETDKNLNERISHISLTNGPTRELIILKNIEKNFGHKTINVSQNGIHRIRTGYHAEKSPPQFHIVVDILNPEIRMKKIQALGNIAKVYFGELPK